jgi:hypothetical protein
MAYIRQAMSRLKRPRAEFAEALEYTSSNSAWPTWTGRCPLNPEMLILIEQRLGLLRHDVRPDLFEGYRRTRGPVHWQEMPEDRGWSKVIRAAGGFSIAPKVLAPRIGITPGKVQVRRYLEIEWLNKVEHWLGLSRHILRPDLYSGYVRVIPPRQRLPEITEEIEMWRNAPYHRRAA